VIFYKYKLICGTTYLIKDTNIDQQIKSSIERTETKIVSGRKRKSKHEQVIPEDIQKEIGDGRLLYYHEETPPVSADESNSSIIKIKKRR
jgi:hypothetical protein